MGFTLEDISTYSEDQLFQNLWQSKHFIYLDSAKKNSPWSRYSIMGITPYMSFTSKNNRHTIERIGRSPESVQGNPFEKIDELVTKYQTQFKKAPYPFPIAPGAMGYFSYESARYIDDFKFLKNNTDLPDIILGFYDRIILIDHQNKTKHFVTSTLFGRSSITFSELLKTIEKKPVSIKETPKNTHECSLNKEKYNQAFSSAKQAIEDGTIYQINLTTQFTSQLSQAPDKLYKKLRQLHPAPFGTFMNCDPYFILSASPEELLYIHEGMIRSRPIKGTASKSQNPEKDIMQKESLFSSKKDGAELLMIVDLVRHDLTKVCETGTIKVDSLKDIESYGYVHHLVSTISGKLKESTSTIQAFQSLFPGGSITGTPKIQSMKLINDLEPVARNLYTGSIGYFGFNGTSQCNIAIRTIYVNDNKWHLHTGGGIVSDSTSELEWDELNAKAKGLLESLQ